MSFEPLGLDASLNYLSPTLHLSFISLKISLLFMYLILQLVLLRLPRTSVLFKREVNKDFQHRVAGTDRNYL